MEIQNIYEEFSKYINYGLVLISVISSIFAVYYRVKSNIKASISGFIKLAAESNELSGIQKMDMVIKWIKDIIPRIFKVIFTDKVLREMSQNVYNDMDSFKDIYIENATGLTTKEAVKVIYMVKDDPESPISK